MSVVAGADHLLVVTNNRHRVFQRSIIAGAEEIGDERGYSLEVFEAPDDRSGRQLIDRLEGSRAGVLLVADVLGDATARALRESGTTITLVSHRIPGLDVPAIMHDNRQGMALLAAKVLDERGSSSPVFLCGSARQQDGVQRESAFRRELMRRGLALDESRFLRGEFEPDQAAAALSDFLEAGGRLDSLLAADYLMAIACLEVLRGHGIAVPRDVPVVGFGDGPEAESAGLTTVAADVVELGRRGARQLVGQLEGLDIHGLTLLSTAMVVRETTGENAPEPAGPKLAPNGASARGRISGKR